MAERATVEVRSIDYVPLHERHGKLWHLFSRSIDVASEARLAEREQRDVEGQASEHATPAASG